VKIQDNRKGKLIRREIVKAA